MRSHHTHRATAVGQLRADQPLCAWHRHSSSLCHSRVPLAGCVCVCVSLWFVQAINAGWDLRRTLKQNYESMGLSTNPNQALPIKKTDVQRKEEQKDKVVTLKSMHVMQGQRTTQTNSNNNTQQRRRRKQARGLDIALALCCADAVLVALCCLLQSSMRLPICRFRSLTKCA